MIKTITGGKYLNVMGAGAMNPYFSPGGQGAGQMRYNTNSNNIEVWDGATWRELGVSYASVELTGEAQELLDWAKQRRSKDVELERLMEIHPIVKNLKEQLDVAVALVQRETSTQEK